VDLDFHVDAFFCAASSHSLEEQTMESTKVEGALQEVAGDVQQAAGDLQGDAGTQFSGKAKELRGQAKQLYADLTDVVRQSTVERPFAALMIAGGIGFILGALRASSRARPANVLGDWRDRE
jgi:uncharacterized protein YjbJ (UPF0337 family)